jgi:hypothetical protein
LLEGRGDGGAIESSLKAWRRDVPGVEEEGEEGEVDFGCSVGVKTSGVGGEGGEEGVDGVEGVEGERGVIPL